MQEWKYKEVPVIAMKGMTILPKIPIHFDISRKRSINAVESAMKSDRRVFLVTQINQENNEPTGDDIYKTGVMARIRQLTKNPNGVVRIYIEEPVRAKIEQVESKITYMTANITVYPVSQNFTEEAVEATTRIIKEMLGAYFMINPKLNKEALRNIIAMRDIEDIMLHVMGCIPVYYEDKQKFLEVDYVSEQYKILSALLSKEIRISEIKADFQKKVQNNIDKNQKDYILREQMKVIRSELGEEDTVSEADFYLTETNKLNADDEVKKKLQKEIKRFKTLSSGSSESNVVRGYIETLLEMPWNNESEDNLDIKNAKKILERDHYGLEKVKERVLEFLAVRAFALKNNNGVDLEGKRVSPIICLYGPPGTGKTSIAKSIAESLNKKYIRICLGGVRDEAEIRGHRRTYVGAMPGRIATGLRNAKVNNPLVLLDEIDKLASDHKGDPASALLEVLDSEQNDRFRDNYIEVPLDLSNVLFIATANDLSTIPRPLLDRMEVIDISGYTSNEKEHIAEKHLLVKQRKAHCLKKAQLSISKKAISSIINGYTKEAGVRNLEREIGKVCRKAAKEILEGEKIAVKINEKNLEEYLGKRKYNINPANEKDEIGIVRGLAWTAVGGETLEIEINSYKGKGELILTGKLGDVMKESARTALSYVRSVAGMYGVREDFFEKNDLHIHIPEGAVPKDGPSAGITMATAIMSVASQKPVKASVAMTGEITLRGRVLPIGGLKEKLLAAKKAGIKNVLVPKGNEADVLEIQEEITDGLCIKYMEKMEQVLKEALSDEN